MSSVVIQQTGTLHTNKCPHGAPLGSCPICNGMGGSIKTADHTAKPGEMSWNECAAIGAMIRAQKAAKAAEKKSDISFTKKMLEFEKNIANITQNLAMLSSSISKKFPSILSAPTDFVLNKILGNTLNIIKLIPATIRNIVQKFVDISDKLAAVYGEIKASVAKKFGELFDKFKKKFKSIFSIFETKDTKDEEKHTDEAKKTFSIKTFIHDLYKKLKSENLPYAEQQKGNI